jgi:hypothetical protein
MKLMNRTLKITSLSLLAAVGAMGQTPNVLNSNEVAAGYENLFDGIAPLVDKWYGITGNNQTSYSFSNTIPASWTVQTENDYKVVQVGAGGQNHIATRDSTYRNFDLKVEWKVPTNSNSGVFLRFLKIASWGGASGSEVQVVSVDHSDGQQSLHRAGTNYDMFPLRAGQENWFRPINQWNEMRVIAYENRIAHYGNGIKLLEYDMNSTAYANAYALSKYKTYPNYKTIHAGAFYLQHHGEIGIKYRSMRVKKFNETQNPWAPGSPYLKAGSSTELVDTLPMATAMYAPVAIAPAGYRAEESVILTRQNGGVFLRFPRQGDYTVEARDLAGTLVSRHQAVGVTQFSVPVEKATHTQVLSVSSNGKKIFSRLISPL